MLPETSTASPNTADFVPLPNERTIFKSSNRTSLSLTTPKSTYPAHSPNIAITSSDGTIYLTNQRIIYLPRHNSSISSNVASFKSFSCPLLNLHDTHLAIPWFGPNAWTALVQSVPGGHLPVNSAIELKLTFKEGGAPEFQSKFEAIKERLQQVVETARESNTTSRGGVDMTAVHLDELPSYQDSGHDRVAPASSEEGAMEQREDTQIPANATMEQVRAMAAAAATQRQSEHIRRQSREEQAVRETPNDAPPGYEEAQGLSLQDELGDHSRT